MRPVEAGSTRRPGGGSELSTPLGPLAPGLPPSAPSGTLWLQHLAQPFKMLNILYFCLAWSVRVLASQHRLGHAADRQHERGTTNGTRAEQSRGQISWAAPAGDEHFIQSGEKATEVVRSKSFRCRGGLRTV